MKSILIPTDFSRNAWNAISFALKFLQDQRCTFYFLHTYTPAFYRMDYALGGPEFTAIPDKNVEASLKGMEMTIAKVKKKYDNPKHVYRTRSAFNVLTDEVNALCEKKDVDMVIMGTQGASGAKELFLGSNAVHVIRKSKVPVLAIPSTCKFIQAKKMLFAVDYISKYNREDLYMVIEMAKMFDSEITVFHVNDINDLNAQEKANKDFLSLCLEQIEFKVKEVNGYHVAISIFEYLQEHAYDILILMNRKHTFLERLTRPQVVEKMAFHAEIPMLILPNTIID